MTSELLNTQDEFDFSGDSVVEKIESVWTIVDATSEDTENDKGMGTRHVIEFTSDALPFPVSVRQFVKYTYKNGGGDDSWVKRSRGILKGLAKAATGEPKYSLAALIGKQVRATTRDDGNGYYTLGRFKSVNA